MKKLSGLDTVFVAADSDAYPMHGGGVMVFDPSTSTEPWTLNHVRSHLLKLLPVMPSLRR